jgi:ferritin
MHFSFSQRNKERRAANAYANTLAFYQRQGLRGAAAKTKARSFVKRVHGVVL